MLRNRRSVNLSSSRSTDACRIYKIRQHNLYRRSYSTSPAPILMKQMTHQLPSPADTI